MSARAAIAALLALGLLSAAAPAARAEGAAADTTVEGYVRSMSDSTDAWFGISAAGPDTAGVDSLRAWALSHPGRSPRRNPTRVSFMPLLAFNRALGGALGAEAAASLPAGLGHMDASANWTTGADRWFGGGEYVKRWPRPAVEDAGTVFTLRVARDWDGLDRDFHDPLLSSAWAFLYGGDRDHYLRRDGAGIDWIRRGGSGWIGLGARDQLESPLPAVARWYLTGHSPAVVGNDSAAAGRVHELDVRAGWRLPRLPFTLEGRIWTAGGSLGGDLDYTRMRVALGGAVALGRHLALAPEGEYARLTGSAPPQDVFLLGGGTLRSAEPGALQGTGRALAHADLILLDPLQRLLGFDRNPTFPLQAGAFVGTGSVWGRDPLTGRAQPTSRDLPARADWLPEAGLSLLYRPGLPWPDTFIRLDWAVPFGPGGRERRFVLTYARALNFLRQH